MFEKELTDLRSQVAELEKKYPEGSDVPLPDSWGGYRIRPTRFEFWLARPSRLHDRFQYDQIDGVWRITRLQP